MPEQQKTDYQQLETGYQFRPVTYQLDKTMAASYLEAVGETSRLFQTGLVPPMAVAAYAMAALSSSIQLPPGTIHVSQELDFIAMVNVGDAITCRAGVLRKHDRGGLHLMTVSIEVLNQDKQKVLAGKTSFVLPA